MEAAIRHKWLGELLCNSKSKNSDAGIRPNGSGTATCMSMESVEETGNKSQTTDEIRGHQTKSIRMGKQQEGLLPGSAQPDTAKNVEQQVH